MAVNANAISEGNSREDNQHPGTAANQSGSAVLNKQQNTDRVQFLFMACLFGVVMGVVFIVIQPLFGMDTLTSRHAGAYQQLGNWSSFAAITIAWAAHLVVSLFYGLLSGVAVLSTG